MNICKKVGERHRMPSLRYRCIIMSLLACKTMGGAGSKKRIEFLRFDDRIDCFFRKKVSFILFYVTYACDSCHE